MPYRVLPGHTATYEQTPSKQRGRAGSNRRGGFVTEIPALEGAPPLLHRAAGRNRRFGPDLVAPRTQHCHLMAKNEDLHLIVDIGAESQNHEPGEPDH